MNNDLISRQAAIDALKSQLSDWNDDYNIPVRKSIENIERLPSAQPEPEIYWGYTPTYERPLADMEIVSRLQDIQKQVGGSYAIDRAVEVIEAIAERRTDERTD